MNLIKCTDCGKDISPSVKFCPHCGKRYYIGTNKVFSYGCLSVVILGVILFVIISVTSNPDKPHLVKNDIIETRVAIKDNINVRKGPGKEYEVHNTVYKDETIYVLKDTAGWVQFRTTKKDVGWSGWLDKRLTKGYKERTYSDVVNDLQNSGLIVKITPYTQSVYVNNFIWQSYDYDLKVQTAIQIAAYCEEITKNKFITIYDSKSGKKLADYSPTFGLDAE